MNTSDHASANSAAPNLVDSGIAANTSQSAPQTQAQAEQETSAASAPAYRYNAELARRIEEKWQQYWDEHGTFWAANPTGDLTDEQGKHADGRTPYFAISMFPFPSGKGLHVGHPLGYLATDVASRYHRMKGENVLFAMGYDAFGLPAEQYAVQTGQHPRVTTEANIANMRRQLHRMGLSLDERRTFATIDEDYVRWTQWIFLQLYNAWYDPEHRRADGGVGGAQPIATLIEQFKAGGRALPHLEGVAAEAQWADLTPSQRETVLNQYRLAYVDTSPVNWCPGLGTVLANEEVTADGRSERGNFPVFKRELQQWSMRITAYAGRLLEDLDTIDWPEKVKIMQRNWIGKSRGARIRFAVESAHDDHAAVGEKARELEIYTTRPDTLFGTTFMVVSPEHPLLASAPEAWQEGIPEAWKGGAATPREAVQTYRARFERKSAKAAHEDDGTAKTGVFTGLYAQNPVTGAQLPIFTADYVLMEYGTGAIMAVPGGDERDYAFAQGFGLPVIRTVAPNAAAAGADEADEAADESQDLPYTSHEGVVIHSSIAATALDGKPLSLDGLSVDEAAARMTDWLEAHHIGTSTVSYRLRDWLFSRQRYWGEPFPIVYDKDGTAHALPESMLPVSLPDVPDYQPKTYDPYDADSQPETPLSRNADWVSVQLDLGDGMRTYHRDTNTMPNWAGSCWYYMRYVDPRDQAHLVEDPDFAYWLGPNHNATAGATGGVDLYVGGVEHAVLHLLYARFWHKALFDLGVINAAEPFHRLFNQGMIQAYAYTDARGQYVPAADVVEAGHDAQGNPCFTYQGEPVQREFGKMGKSLKNIVTPDDMYRDYGADTFRLHEMYMGPLAESRPWNLRNVVGVMRFLQRLWRNVVDEETGKTVVVDTPMNLATRKLVNTTIAEVSAEMEGLRPNTVIAKLIVLNNHITSLPAVAREAVEPLILMLAPIAPHICEELWQCLGHTASLAREPWPQADSAYVGQDTVTAVVQVQGKVRAKLEVAPDIAPDALQELALQTVAERIAGKNVRKVIVKAPKIVSIVVG